MFKLIKVDLLGKVQLSFQGSPHVRWSKTVSGFCMDHAPGIPDSTYWIPVFVVELGFWIAFVSGIPDSSSCIPDSKAEDFGFYEEHFPGFWIPQEKHFPYTKRQRSPATRLCNKTLEIKWQIKDWLFDWLIDWLIDWTSMAYLSRTSIPSAKWWAGFYWLFLGQNGSF